MWNLIQKWYFEISQESLRQMRLRNKNYSWPNLKDYIISFLLTILFSSPFYGLLGFLLWRERFKSPCFVTSYSCWIMYFGIVFVICFIIPDRMHRVARDVLYVKYKVEELPRYAVLPFGPHKDLQTPAILMCHVSKLISYFFYFLACTLPSTFGFNPYKFPLGGMSFIFVFFTNISFMASFFFIEPYTEPKRKFSI